MNQLIGFEEITSTDQVTTNDYILIVEELVPLSEAPLVVDKLIQIGYNIKHIRYKFYRKILPEGVVVLQLKQHADERGSLLELFRSDELPNSPDYFPEMGYISVTHPHVCRGPHEHQWQTDGFAFVNGEFELYLWENRTDHPGPCVTLEVGKHNPVFVIVPPGVVHAYRNVSNHDAFVLNFPNQLYAGPGKSEEVDEIRHEFNNKSPFQIPKQ